MSSAQLSVSEFKAHCTSLLRDLEEHPRQIEVTNRGRVIAVVSPPPSPASPDPATWLGSLRGSVLRYDEPFAPAAAPADWQAMKD